MKVIQIGRGPDNDLNLSGDTLVSRQHCTIIGEDNGTVKIIDRHSTNGTFINGKRMYGEAFLRPGDVVMVGNTVVPWQSYFPPIPVSGGPTRMDFNSPGGNKDFSRYGQSSGTNGYSGNNGTLMPKPANYLVWAILSIFFCCLPFGIVSVVYASKVDSLWNTGDYIGAERAASKARLWFWWAFGIGLALNLFWVVYYIAVGSILVFI